MLAFLKSLAGPVLKHAIKMAGNCVGMGVPVNIAIDCWDGFWKRKSEAEVLQAVEQVAQEQRKLRQELVIFIEQIAPDQPEEIKQRTVNYLNMVPAAIQRSLRRPDDLSGRTVPKNLRIRGPADLQQFLPPMPRFNIGDHPVAGTDLVLEEFIGIGGFGEVWKATHQTRPKAPPVALKFCTDADAAAKSLHREVDLLDRVTANKGRPNNIVELKYAHLQADPPCLEYEYISGGDLANLLCEFHEQNRATPIMIAQIMLQLTSAVGSAHDIQPPIIHRDLKPANVLVHRTGGKFALKVADFGIGNVAAEHDAQAPANTTTTQAFTPLYASPQQRMGRPADPRDDVYALGVIWYQLLIGDLRSEAPRGGGWKRRLAEQGMSAELLTLLEQCVEDRAEDRPANAVVVAKQLRDYLNAHRELIAADYVDIARKSFMPDGNPKHDLSEADYERVLADCSEAIRLNPKSVAGYLLRASVYERRDSEDADFEKALADCSEAIRLDPKNVECYLARASVYEACSECEKALADHDEIIRLNPNDPEGYLYRAVFNEDNSDDREAIIADYAEAFRLDPNLAITYRSRASIYFEDIEYKKALADSTEAIRLSPNDAKNFVARAEIHAEHLSEQHSHVDLEDSKKAVADYTEAIRLNPKDAKSYLERAYILYWYLDAYEKAHADFTEVIRLTPKDPAGYEGRADTYDKMGEKLKAAADREHAARLKAP